MASSPALILPSGSFLVQLSPGILETVVVLPLRPTAPIRVAILLHRMTPIQTCPSVSNQSKTQERKKKNEKKVSEVRFKSKLLLPERAEMNCCKAVEKKSYVSRALEPTSTLTLCRRRQRTSLLFVPLRTAIILSFLSLMNALYRAGCVIHPCSRQATSLVSLCASLSDERVRCNNFALRMTAVYAVKNGQKVFERREGEASDTLSRALSGSISLHRSFLCPSSHRDLPFALDLRQWKGRTRENSMYQHILHKSSYHREDVFR